MSTINTGLQIILEDFLPLSNEVPLLVITNVESQEDITYETEKRCIIEKGLSKIMVLGRTIIQFEGKFG